MERIGVAVRPTGPRKRGDADAQQALVLCTHWRAECPAVRSLRQDLSTPELCRRHENITEPQPFMSILQRRGRRQRRRPRLCEGRGNKEPLGFTVATEVPRGSP